MMEQPTFDSQNEIAAVARSGPPWEDESTGNIFERFFKTVMLGIADPVKYYATMSTSGGYLQPLLFTVILATMVSFFSGLIVTPFEIFTGTPVVVAIITSALAVIIQPIIIPLIFLSNAAVMHCTMYIFGWSKHGFESTLRVNSYAAAPAVVNVVPILGLIVYMFWFVIMIVIGIREVHELDNGKAILTAISPLVLVPILFIIFSIFFFIIFFIFGIMIAAIS